MLQSGDSFGAENGSRLPEAARWWREFWRARGGVVGGVLLFAIVLGTFLPVIDNDFVGYDDPLYVTANRQVQAGLTWEGVRWAFASSEAANWHPLTWLSHMADCQLFGPQPWGHHLTALLLHGLNTVLLFAVLRRLTGATGRSLALALLFGLHPLRVESVAWVAERKDVLSTLFWMLTLWAYARYAEHSKVQGQRLNQAAQYRSNLNRNASHSTKAAIKAATKVSITPKRADYGLSFGFFCLGLMCKPMLVTVPCVLLLLDYWPLARWSRQSARRLVVEKLPFFFVSLVVSGITMVVQRHGGAMEAGTPFVARAENALLAYGRYLGKLAWPVDLSFFYPPVSHWPPMTVIWSAGLLLVISLAVVQWRRRQPYLLTGWLWFVGTLVPVIGLIQVGEQAMADRYSYMPSVGILLMLVWGLPAAVGQWRFRALGLAAITVVAVLLCFLLTRQQIRYWKDNEILCRHALLLNPDNYVAHNNLGTTLDHQRRLEEAIHHYQQALEAKPSYAEAMKNLGVALDHQGRLEEAIRRFRQALTLRPNDAEVHKDLAEALDRQGRPDEAMHHYHTALALKPDYADARFNLGVDLLRQGHPDEAIREFQETVRLQPDSPEAHNNLGTALDQKGLLEEAIAHYLQAIALKPDYARAHFNLGVAWGRQGRLNEAIAEYQQALALKPDYAAAQTNLAALLNLKNSR